MHPEPSTARYQRRPGLVPAYLSMSPIHSKPTSAVGKLLANQSAIEISILTYCHNLLKVGR